MEDILNSLNFAQKEAVCHTGSPLLILAGAGSGKTRVITTKIAWLIQNNYVSPEEILAVTFTNKAAKEMHERAVSLCPQAVKTTIRTFHSFGAWLLRRYGTRIGLAENFTIYDTADSATLLSKAVPEVDKKNATNYIHQISRAKDYCYTPEDTKENGFFIMYKTQEMYEAYQSRLKETGNVDFGDLIQLPVMLLNNNPDIKARIQNRFKVIMVDEYQDSNIAQFELLKALKNDSTYICVVGDDDQSIYKFRGAEIDNILNFADVFKNTKIIKLEENYRSYSEILDVANCIIANNTGRLGKELIAARGSSTKPTLAYLPTDNSRFDDAISEADYCTRLITEDVKNGGKFSDWAILYRTNAQSRLFETHFSHNLIPYQVVGSVKFYEREEIKDALAVLAIVLNGRDEVAFARIINKPARGIGPKTQDKLIAFARSNMININSENITKNALPFEYTDYEANGFNDIISIVFSNLAQLKLSKKTSSSLKQFLEIIFNLRERLNTGVIETDDDSSEKKELKGNKLGAFLELAITNTDLYSYHKNQDDSLGTDKISNLQELINTASLYEFSFDGLKDFLDHIELDNSLNSQADNENKNAVTLITVHTTKGLEFPNVIITGLEEKIFPIDKDGDEIEEERRLMYVACTRAMNKLYMTTCTKRMRYGNICYMEPSRFIDEIEPSLIEVQDFTAVDTISSVYKQKKETNFAQFGKIIEAPNTKHQVVYDSKWKKNTKVFSSDHGWGIVVSVEEIGGEIVMEVKFQTGAKKKYMPKYSTGDLEILD